MKLPQNLKLLSAFLIIFFSFCGCAFAITINFDFLPNGTPVESLPPTVISNQYQEYGVLFSAINRFGFVISPVATATTGHEATSQPNILLNSELDPWYPIIMDFITPFSGTIDLALIGVGDSLVTTSAFGVDLSTLIDSADVVNPGTERGINEIDWITLSGNNISRITFVTTTGYPGDGWGIDDVGLTPASAVPEPASLSLLGLGLLGFIFKRRGVNEK